MVDLTHENAMTLCPVFAFANLGGGHRAAWERNRYTSMRDKKATAQQTARRAVAAADARADWTRPVASPERVQCAVLDGLLDAIRSSHGKAGKLARQRAIRWAASNGWDWQKEVKPRI